MREWSLVVLVAKWDEVDWVTSLLLMSLLFASWCSVVLSEEKVWIKNPLVDVFLLFFSRWDWIWREFCSVILLSFLASPFPIHIWFDSISSSLSLSLSPLLFCSWDTRRRRESRSLHLISFLEMNVLKGDASSLFKVNKRDFNWISVLLMSPSSSLEDLFWSSPLHSSFWNHVVILFLFHEISWFNSHKVVGVKWMRRRRGGRVEWEERFMAMVFNEKTWSSSSSHPLLSPPLFLIR